MNETRLEISRRLRLARKNAGLSQGQVARLVDLHRPTVSEIEAGRRKVSAEEVAMLADIYEVSVNWLVSGSSTGDADDRIELAARELLKLRREDLDRVIQLIQSVRETNRAETAG